MPASSTHSQRTRPAGPTKGCPWPSSLSPGCSPISIKAADRRPSPNAVCMGARQKRTSLHSSDAFAGAGRDVASGTNGVAFQPLSATMRAMGTNCPKSSVTHTSTTRRQRRHDDGRQRSVMWLGYHSRSGRRSVVDTAVDHAVDISQERAVASSVDAEYPHLEHSNARSDSPPMGWSSGN